MFEILMDWLLTNESDPEGLPGFALIFNITVAIVIYSIKGIIFAVV